MIDENSQHFIVFKESLKKKLRPNDPGGKPWSTFTNGLSGLGDTVPRFDPPNRRIGRDEIFQIAQDQNVSTMDVAAAALCWGGMHMRYHKGFFEAADCGWKTIAQGIRDGELSRDKAYEGFRKLRENGHMPGVGPAFFTKLIYFLGRKNGSADHLQGYIVDQWTASSINLLTGKPIIHLNVLMTPGKQGNPSRYVFGVSDANSAAAYEKFCFIFDKLISMCKHSADEIDHALQRPGTWRDYVSTHRKP